MGYKTAFDWFPGIYNKERYYNRRKVNVHQVDLSRGSRDGYRMYMSLAGDVFVDRYDRYVGELRALHFFTMNEDWQYIIIEDIVIPRIEIAESLFKPCCEEIESNYRCGLHPDLTYDKLLAAADELKFECVYMPQHLNLKNQPVAVNSLVVAFRNDNKVFSDEPQPNMAHSNFEYMDIGFLDTIFEVQDCLLEIFENQLAEYAYNNGYEEIVNRYYFDD